MKTFWILTLTFILGGCMPSEEYVENKKKRDEIEIMLSLPDQAENIVYLGNSWACFELDGNKFLFHHDGDIREGYESLTQVIDR